MLLYLVDRRVLDPFLPDRFVPLKLYQRFVYAIVSSPFSFMPCRFASGYLHSLGRSRTSLCYLFALFFLLFEHRFRFSFSTFQFLAPFALHNLVIEDISVPNGLVPLKPYRLL